MYPICVAQDDPVDAVWGNDGRHACRRQIVWCVACFDEAAAPVRKAKVSSLKHAQTHRTRKDSDPKRTKQNPEEEAAMQSMRSRDWSIVENKKKHEEKTHL